MTENFFRPSPFPFAVFASAVFASAVFAGAVFVSVDSSS